MLFIELNFKTYNNNLYKIYRCDDISLWVVSVNVNIVVEGADGGARGAGRDKRRPPRPRSSPARRSSLAAAARRTGGAGAVRARADVPTCRRADGWPARGRSAHVSVPQARTTCRSSRLIDMWDCDTPLSLRSLVVRNETVCQIKLLWPNLPTGDAMPSFDLPSW